MATEPTRKAPARYEVIDREFGLWCNACRLPSGIRVYIAVWANGRMQFQTHLVCDDCNGRDVTPEA